MRWAEGFIAVDWGTTNRRAWMIDRTGHCRGEIEDDQYLLRKGLIALLDGRIALPIFQSKPQPAPALPDASAPVPPKELEAPKR